MNYILFYKSLKVNLTLIKPHKEQLTFNNVLTCCMNVWIYEWTISSSTMKLAELDVTFVHGSHTFNWEDSNTSFYVVVNLLLQIVFNLVNNVKTWINNKYS